jgi:hypothetical protein
LLLRLSLAVCEAGRRGGRFRVVLLAHCGCGIGLKNPSDQINECGY